MNVNKFIPMVLFVPTIVYASLYYNQVKIGNNVFSLDKIDDGVMHINDGRSNYTCRIDNWNAKFNRGAGVISKTTDGKAILLENSDSYLYVNDMINCHGDKIFLHKIPIPGTPPFGRVIDLNFDKKLYLSVIAEDIQSNMYTAVISHFNSKANIISSNGFYSEKSSSEAAFHLSFNGHGGKISLDGKYIYPAELDCSTDSFPGVWDINKRKKVVFSSAIYDDESINKKCHSLFNGDSSLQVLGGKLITPHK